MNSKKLVATIIAILASALCISTFVFASEAENTTSSEKALEKQEKVDKKSISLEELLSKVKVGRVRDMEVNAERLKIFKSDVLERKANLDALESRKSDAEELSKSLEEMFTQNDEVLADLEKKLDQRLGSIKELFGVLQQVSSDAHTQLTNSVTQLHYPGREEYLLNFSSKMGQTKELPKIKEIEQLWFELQREIVTSGEVKKFEHNIVSVKGEDEQRELVRVGVFNLIADGKYLQFIPETSRVIEYMRQPRARFVRGAEDLSSSAPGQIIDFSVDPTRGQLLSLLVRAPNLQERIGQGGVIGYIIISVGVFAFLIAIQRLFSLISIRKRIEKQIGDKEPSLDNPLGRILAAYDANKAVNMETIELKLGEAMLKEIPQVNKNISLLKIIAAIAPLMGLLGTVTGMIVTFQAITLFGAGDPKLMAGGISQALMTTVLGLVVAIPTLLLHNLVQGNAKRITEILEHESVALIADHVESKKS